MRVFMFMWKKGEIFNYKKIFLTESQYSQTLGSIKEGGTMVPPWCKTGIGHTHPSEMGPLIGKIEFKINWLMIGFFFFGFFYGYFY